MPQCPAPNCGKVIGDRDPPPACDKGEDCGFRVVQRRATRSANPTLTWVNPFNGNAEKKAAEMIHSSIKKIQQAIAQQGAIYHYKLDGAESAIATYTDSSGASFEKPTSADNMHAEMCLAEQLLSGDVWKLEAGKITCATGAVSGMAFKTNVPHCGYCSVVLHVLGLPLTMASVTSHNKASEGIYPLPRQLVGDHAFLARMVGAGKNDRAAYEALKQILDVFVSGPRAGAWVLEIEGQRYASGEGASATPIVVTWNQIKAARIDTTTLLAGVWRSVWWALYAKAAVEPNANWTPGDSADASLSAPMSSSSSLNVASESGSVPSLTSGTLGPARNSHQGSKPGYHPYKK